MLLIFAPKIMKAFRADDTEVIASGTLALRLQCLTMPVMPFYTITSMTFQVLGRSTAATVLSSARQGIFFLPLILIIPRLFGLIGVQCSQPIADLGAFAIALFMMMPLLKTLKHQAQEETANES